MNSKQLLTLQTISTLPLLLFMLIYANNISILYLSIPIVLTLFLVYNFISFRKKTTIIKPPLLLILVISFLFYSFYHLGSKEAPQTFEKIDINTNAKQIIFDLKEEQRVDKICYYIGIDRNVKFRLGAFENGKWRRFYKYDKNFPYSFRWNCKKVNIKTAKIGILVSKGEAFLGEIRFIDKNRTIPFTTRYAKKLNDETDINADTSYYGGMFFDEIYFGRTAYEILHKLKIYETTHPFLGKALISQGIKLFKMTPYGWRFINVLFGAFMIVIVYYLALLIFKNYLYAFSSALLITYSFMHMTQTRLAIVDTFGVTFVLISYYFLYRFILKQKLEWLIISGIFFGLASAIKWSAVFASLGFLLISIYLLVSKYPFKERFRGYRLILYGVLSYIIVGVGVYYLTFYIYMENNSFSDIIKYQVDMYKYHTALKATHPYSSEWWSWIIDYRPMCYYRKIVGDRFTSITVFGNPAIFWIGTVGILYLIYSLIRYRKLEVAFILSAFLGLYLPYIFVGRLMFIYHFYYAVPFMILSIVYLFKELINRDKILYIYLTIVISLFLAYYPVLSGYEVAKWYIDNYLVWFNGWWL